MEQSIHYAIIVKEYGKVINAQNVERVLQTGQGFEFLLYFFKVIICLIQVAKSVIQVLLKKLQYVLNVYGEFHYVVVVIVFGKAKVVQNATQDLQIGNLYRE